MTRICLYDISQIEYKHLRTWRMMKDQIIHEISSTVSEIIGFKQILFPYSILIMSCNYIYSLTFYITCYCFHPMLFSLRVNISHYWKLEL